MGLFVEAMSIGPRIAGTVYDSFISKIDARLGLDKVEQVIKGAGSQVEYLIVFIRNRASRVFSIAFDTKISLSR
jgi:hypothetical protein